MGAPKVLGCAITLATGFALLGCGGAGHDASAVGHLPRALILITIDGLRADELSAAGGEGQMAHLDALVEQGRLWTDVWTACPMSRPAVATYLTGLPPDRHGVRDDRLTSLDDGVATLAEVLRERGYATAAFPDSSFLGPASGLLRGFDVVDDPPAVPIAPLTWTPLLKRPAKLAEDFGAYLASRPADERFFAWIHISVLLSEQIHGPDLAGTETPEAPTLTEEASTPSKRVDDAIGTMLRTLEQRVPAAETAVIVAATLADVGGGAEEMTGPGFSLAEPAIRVPIIARFPGGTASARSATSLGWSPDVPVTLAGLAGAVLPGAEGLTLLDEVELDRAVFSWSWATRDQLGWRPLRAARRGALKRTEGFDDRTIDLGGRPVVEANQDVESLRAALAGRGEAPAPDVPLEPVRGLLERRGLRLDPVPAGGRDFGPAAARVEIGRATWKGRRQMLAYAAHEAVESYEQVLRLDPQNLGGLLALGQYRSFRGRDALSTLRPALERYPSNPDLLHWWAHALWADSSDSWREAEVFLKTILPLDPHNGDLLYDLACTRSLADDCETSSQFLRSAIAAGYQQWEHIDTDADLRNLRECGGFAEVLREFRR